MDRTSHKYIFQDNRIPKKQKSSLFRCFSAPGSYNKSSNNQRCQDSIGKDHEIPSLNQCGKELVIGDHNWQKINENETEEDRNRRIKSCTPSLKRSGSLLNEKRSYISPKLMSKRILNRKKEKEVPLEKSLHSFKCEVDISKATTSKEIQTSVECSVKNKHTISGIKAKLNTENNKKSTDIIIKKEKQEVDCYEEETHLRNTPRASGCLNTVEGGCTIDCSDRLSDNAKSAPFSVFQSHDRSVEIDCNNEIDNENNVKYDKCSELSDLRIIKVENDKRNLDVEVIEENKKEFVNELQLHSSDLFNESLDKFKQVKKKKKFMIILKGVLRGKKSKHKQVKPRDVKSENYDKKCDNSFINSYNLQVDKNLQHNKSLVDVNNSIKCKSNKSSKKFNNNTSSEYNYKNNFDVEEERVFDERKKLSQVTITPYVKKSSDESRCYQGISSDGIQKICTSLDRKSSASVSQIHNNLTDWHYSSEPLTTADHLTLLYHASLTKNCSSAFIRTKCSGTDNEDTSAAAGGLQSSPVCKGDGETDIYNYDHLTCGQSQSINNLLSHTETTCASNTNDNEDHVENNFVSTLVDRSKSKEIVLDSKKLSVKQFVNTSNSIEVNNKNSHLDLGLIISEETSNCKTFSNSLINDDIAKANEESNSLYQANQVELFTKDSIGKTLQSTINDALTNSLELVNDSSNSSSTQSESPLISNYLFNSNESDSCQLDVDESYHEDSPENSLEKIVLHISCGNSESNKSNQDLSQELIDPNYSTSTDLQICNKEAEKDHHWSVEPENESCNSLAGTWYNGEEVDNYLVSEENIVVNHNYCEGVNDLNELLKVNNDKASDLKSCSYDVKIREGGFLDDFISDDEYKSEVNTIVNNSDTDIFDSDSDLDSDNDSSVDYDLPPLDDSIYDLRYDPYFYQSSFSLDNIPDDQPIDYPLPFDYDNRRIVYQNNNLNASEESLKVPTDNWWHRFGQQGDIYRTQSQPENLESEIRDDKPLDGNLPLHVFLSQSQPLVKDYANVEFESSNSSFKRRRESGSLGTGGSFDSQLYTITEETENDIPLDEFQTSINGSDFSICELPELESDSTPTATPTSSLNVSAEDISSKNSLQSKYPDEFFLFCSEAEITKMEVMDNVDMMTYNNSNMEDFKYFRVDTRNSSSSDEPEYLVDSFESNSKLDQLTYDSSTSNQNAWFDKNKPKQSVLRNNSIDNEKHMSCGEQAKNKLFSPIYQNVPLTKRLTKSNPDLTNDEPETIETSSSVYQNIPVPAKRYSFLNGNQNKILPPYQNVPKTIFNSKRKNSLEDIPKSSRNFEYSNNQFYSDNSSDDDMQYSNASFSSLDDKPTRRKFTSNTKKNLLSSDKLNIHSTFSNLSSLSSCNSLKSSEFVAYASNTTLDTDTFSKASKVYKWNGSSSVSDLTSLSKEVEQNEIDQSNLSRSCASASDLPSLTSSSDSRVVTKSKTLGETSYMAWSARLSDLDDDDEDFILPVEPRMTSSSFVFTPHLSKYIYFQILFHIKKF